MLLNTSRQNPFSYEFSNRLYAMFPPTFKIAGVIPAAGQSARMGCDKRRLPLGKMTLLEMTVSNLTRAGCSPVVVVLEPASPCSGLEMLREPPVSVVNLMHPSPNMRTSICAGLRSLPDEVYAAAVMPADCPLISTRLISSILEEYMRLRPLLFVPTYKGQQGHPRILAKEIFRDIYAMPEQDRFSSIFSRRSEVSVWFETGDPAIVMDCDTLPDYEALLKEWQKVTT